MKKGIAITGLLILAGIGAYWYFFASSGPATGLSDDQAEVRDLFGAPAQFSISYQPQGEAGGYVRSEVWRYPELKKEVTFLAGRIFSTEDYEPQAGLVPTELRPEQFDLTSSVDDINTALNEDAVLLEVPGLTGDATQTYASDQALFILDGGSVTYFETVSTTTVPVE
jgi:hypothetical protein